MSSAEYFCIAHFVIGNFVEIPYNTAGRESRE